MPCSFTTHQIDPFNKFYYPKFCQLGCKKGYVWISLRPDYRGKIFFNQFYFLNVIHYQYQYVNSTTWNWSKFMKKFGFTAVPMIQCNLNTEISSYTKIFKLVWELMRCWMCEVLLSIKTILLKDHEIMWVLPCHSVALGMNFKFREQKRKNLIF